MRPSATSVPHVLLQQPPSQQRQYMYFCTSKAIDLSILAAANAFAIEMTLLHKGRKKKRHDAAQQDFRTSKASKLRACCGPCVCHRNDVCGRMLTYADVC